MFIAGEGTRPSRLGSILAMKPALCGSQSSAKKGKLSTGRFCEHSGAIFLVESAREAARGDEETGHFIVRKLQAKIAAWGENFFRILMEKNGQVDHSTLSC